MPRLVIVSEEVPAASCELRMGVNRIGRALQNDLSIEHPSVSGVHCEVVWLNGIVRVRDCGSTNGTYVDGTQIRESTLVEGQVLQVGGVALAMEGGEARVAVPELRGPEVKIPVQLPDGRVACPVHETVPAVYRCTQCKHLMCERCVHQLRRVGGQPLLLCAICSQPCDRIVASAAKKSFLKRLGKTIRVVFEPYDKRRRC